MPTAKELMAHPHDAHGRLLNCDELASRVEKVLALHKQIEQTYGQGYTSQVETAQMCLICDESWPCPTVRILNGGE